MANRIRLETQVQGILPIANGGTGLSALGSGVATFLGAPSSANLAIAVTDETGTGGLVFANTPSLVTPNIAGATMTGTITVPSPTNATDAVNKSYVDWLLNGNKWKEPVIAATTANGTLASAFANGQTIDGVTLTTGDRILIKNQTTGSENGIYIVQASGAPVRSLDADSGTELINASVFISQGTVNADTAYVCTNNSVTLGVTSITFVQFSATSSSANISSSIVVATASQTVFTTPTYTTGASKLQVYVNGLNQEITTDYAETSTTSITFVSGLTAGDRVKFVAIA